MRDTDREHRDLSGLTFGKRTVHWPAGRKDKTIMWLCTCQCGKISVVSGKSISNGGSLSCISCGLTGRNTTHGVSKSSEYMLYHSAKGRAKKRGIPFSIGLEDVVIPAVCPLLGIPIVRGRGTGKLTPNSPSLDRKTPTLGYVDGNVWVVSYRANAIKNDASLEELKLLVDNLSSNQ